MRSPTGDARVAPVCLIIFNRPEHTRRVFEAIARQKPQRLFVIGDGPRNGRMDDQQLVDAARRHTETIDWQCHVTRLYADVNLGCKSRITSGLNEVFTEVAAAIILEDDCLPSDDFFRYSSALLSKWRSDERVFSIGGHVWEFPDHSGTDSYYFSKYFSSWGWATWADRWNQTRLNMERLPETGTSELIARVADTPMEVVYWQSILDRMKKGDALLAQALDFYVQFAMWQANLVSVRPFTNLVRNIGLGDGATHTTEYISAVAERESGSLDWPLRHPPIVARSVEQDRIVNHVRIGGALFRQLKDRP